MGNSFGLQAPFDNNLVPDFSNFLTVKTGFHGFWDLVVITYNRQNQTLLTTRSSKKIITTETTKTKFNLLGLF